MNVQTKISKSLSWARPSTSTVQTWSDRLGLCLSVACLIHCLATPIILIALPGFSYLIADHDHGHDHGHEMFHQVLLGILPLLAVLAFIPGYRQHRKLEIFYWALPGIVALALGVILTHDTPVLATAITILGSALLVRAHLLNRKECACCATGHGHQRATRLSKVTTKPLKTTMRLKEFTPKKDSTRGEL